MSEFICRFEIMIFAIFFLIGSKSDLNLDLIIEEGSQTRGLPQWEGDYVLGPSSHILRVDLKLDYLAESSLRSIETFFQDFIGVRFFEFFDKRLYFDCFYWSVGI